MQVATFAIEVPLIIITLALLFRFPSVLHVATLASRRAGAITRAVTGAIVAVTIVVKQSVTSSISFSLQDRAAIDRLVYTEPRSRLPLRFMLPRASSGDHAPPSAPTLSIYPGFVHTSVRGAESTGSGTYLRALGNHADATQVCGEHGEKKKEEEEGIP